MIDPQLLRCLTDAQQGLVTTAQARASGCTPDDIRTFQARGEWVALLNGVNLTDADLLTGNIDRRIWWRAALLAHGANACLMSTTGTRAFGLVGLPLHEAVIEIGCIGGLSRHPRFAPALARRLGIELPAIVARQLPLEADQIVDVGGFPVREFGATLIDAALTVDRATVLCLLDSALHLGLIAADELQDLVLKTTNRRGVRTLRAMAAIADGRAESQVESRVRLACIDGCVPPDELQYVVRNLDGHIVAIGDLGWDRERKRPLLAEADGKSVHSTPEAVYRDRWRGNALVGQACDTVRFTYADSFRPSYIAAVIRSALAA